MDISLFLWWKFFILAAAKKVDWCHSVVGVSDRWSHEHREEKQALIANMHALQRWCLSRA